MRPVERPPWNPKSSMAKLESLPWAPHCNLNVYPVPQLLCPPVLPFTGGGGGLLSDTTAPYLKGLPICMLFG